jgi:hypothetical protein
MREHVMQLIRNYAADSSGIYYHPAFLGSLSNKQLVELLLQEHAYSLNALDNE